MTDKDKKKLLSIINLALEQEGMEDMFLFYAWAANKEEMRRLFTELKSHLEKN